MRASRSITTRRPTVYRAAQGDTVADLCQLSDAVDKVALALETPLGNLVPVQRGRYTARPRDIVPVDPSTGSSAVLLPKIEGDVIGKTVIVAETAGSTKTWHVYPADGDVIAGLTSVAISDAYGYLFLLALRPGLWVA